MKTLNGHVGPKQSGRIQETAASMEDSAPKPKIAAHKPSEAHGHCVKKTAIDPSRILLNAQLLKEHGYHTPRAISPGEEGEEFARNERISLLEAQTSATRSKLAAINALVGAIGNLPKLVCYVSIVSLSGLCAYNAHSFALARIQNTSAAIGFCVILPFVGLLFRDQESALARRVINLFGFIAAAAYLTGFAMSFVHEREIDDLSGSGPWKILLFAGQVGLEISLIHIFFGQIKRIERSQLFPHSDGVVAEEREALKRELEGLDAEVIALKKASFIHTIEKANAEKLLRNL